MSRLSSLYRERDDYYAIREKVSQVASRLSSAIANINTVSERVGEAFSIDEVAADYSFLSRVESDEKMTLSKINNRVIPAIDDHIRWLDREIEEELEDDD